MVNLTTCAGGSWSYVSTIGIGTQWALAYVDNSYVFFNSYLFNNFLFFSSTRLLFLTFCRTARDSLEVLTSSDLMSWTEVPSLSINEELSLYRIQVVDEDLYIFLYPLQYFLLFFQLFLICCSSLILCNSSGYFYTTDLTTWFKYDIVAVYYEAIFVLPDTSFVLEGSLASIFSQHQKTKEQNRKNINHTTNKMKTKLEGYLCIDL